MLAGTLRFGSGMTGSGGFAVVTAAVGDLSDVIIGSLGRVLGAGFGVGTAWASADGTNRPVISATASEVERHRLKLNRDGALPICPATRFSCKLAPSRRPQAHHDAA